MVACTLPAIAQSDETAKSFHLLPHLADGGGWQSVLLVTNVSQSASRCTFNVYGVPLNRFRGVTAAGSTTTFQLDGPGGYLIWRTKNELAAVASGYATLDCSAPVVAQVVFAWFGGSGEPTGMATVFSSQAGTVFQFPVLQPAATLGFAIANDTNAEASCRIVLEDYQRTNLGEATLSVPAKSNRAQMLHDSISIPGTFLGGSATVLCNQPVAMIGLHFELRPDGTISTFSTLPPAILSTMLAPADEAAFNDLYVGKRAATNFPTVYTDFVSPGRFRETDTFTGSYTYRNTGSNTGTVTFNYDNGYRCTASLTFDSTTSGTATSMCDDGSSVDYDWRLVEIPTGGDARSGGRSCVQRSLRW